MPKYRLLPADRSAGRARPQLVASSGKRIPHPKEAITAAHCAAAEADLAERRLARAQPAERARHRSERDAAQKRAERAAREAEAVRAAWAEYHAEQSAERQRAEAARVAELARRARGEMPDEREVF